MYVFCKRKSAILSIFHLNVESLNIVDSYTYLGIVFNYNGRFNVTKKKLTEQSLKAMYSIFKKARRLNLTPDLQLKLFDSLVSTILLR